MENLEASESKEINIEEIMQEIRQEILRKKRIGKRDVPVGGKRLSSNFYEQLYLAELMQAEMGVKLLVTKSKIPVIGGLIDRFRTKIHELVLFYVNQAVAQQADINDHLIEAIALLSTELEGGSDEIRDNYGERGQ